MTLKNTTSELGTIEGFGACANMRYKIGDIVLTDGGEYTVKALVARGGDVDDGLSYEYDEEYEYDEHIEVYVGKHDANGRHDLLVRDRAGTRVVGNKAKAKQNWKAWSEIETKCGKLNWSAIAAVDALLSVRLKDSREAARLAIRITPMRHHQGWDDADDHTKIVYSDDEDIGDAIAKAWDKIPWAEIECRWYDDEDVDSAYMPDPVDAAIQRGIGEDDTETWHFSHTSEESPGKEDWEWGNYGRIPYPDYYIAPAHGEYCMFGDWNDNSDRSGWTYFGANGELLCARDFLPQC